MTGPRPETRRTNARGERCCVPQARLLKMNTAHSAQSTPSAGRSGAACSAVLWGAKPARRRQPTPGGKRSAQLFLETKDTAKKGAKPLGLQQPTFGKRQDGATGDDQVIQHPYVH